MVKDIPVAVVVIVVMVIVNCTLISEVDSLGELLSEVVTGIFLGLFCSGIPFGWNWASKVLTATSLYGILIKGVIALFLGWIALQAVIIKDIAVFCDINKISLQTVRTNSRIKKERR